MGAAFPNPLGEKITNKYSLGGQAVLRSLAEVDYYPRPGPALRLAESQGPLLGEGARVVLVQNAWTMLPLWEFFRRLGPYPPRARIYQTARAAFSRTVVYRAKRVLALSEYMGDLVRARRLARPDVFPVRTSLDLFSSDSKLPSGLPLDCRFALVPGSMQPYKRPEMAVRFIEQHRRSLPAIDAIAFCGPTVDTGLAHELRVRTHKLGLTPIIGELNREEMKWALQHSQLTLLPSSLESLSFSLGEALYHAPLVAASPIPAHREVAAGLQAKPMWMDERASSLSFAGPGLSPSALHDQWRRLGEAMLGRANG